MQCFSLVPTTGATCTHCGSTLELEPELVASTMSCPRCSRGLFSLESGEVHLSECKACGGTFLDHQALTVIVTGHRPAAGRVANVMVPQLPPPETQVRYLPCPVCTARMNRAIFGRKSGVVIDVCKMHGTWFDARELTGCVAFIEQGGLERAEKQALEEKREAMRQARIERRAETIGDALNRSVHTRWDMFYDPSKASQTEAVVDLLHVLLGS
jgi:Zn-finger nucleic acid-binding protein